MHIALTLSYSNSCQMALLAIHSDSLWQLDWLYRPMWHFFPDTHRTDNRSACRTLIVYWHVLLYLSKWALVFTIDSFLW